MKLIPSVSLKSVNCIAFTFQHGEEDFPASPPDLFHRPLIHGWSCQENTQRYRFSVICNNTRNIVEGSKRKITVSVGKQFKYNFCPRRVGVVPNPVLKICFGPPTAESKNLKNHVNFDVGDLFFRSPALWSSQNVFGPPTAGRVVVDFKDRGLSYLPTSIFKIVASLSPTFPSVRRNSNPGANC